MKEAGDMGREEGAIGFGQEEEVHSVNEECSEGTGRKEAPVLLSVREGSHPGSTWYQLDQNDLSLAIAQAGRRAPQQGLQSGSRGSGTTEHPRQTLGRCAALV
jgi:hypothetical protein